MRLYPYWGKCTLVICKLRIRSVARNGDWVVGLGGNNVNGTDYSGKVVYGKLFLSKRLKSYFKGLT